MNTTEQERKPFAVRDRGITDLISGRQTSSAPRPAIVGAVKGVILGYFIRDYLTNHDRGILDSLAGSAALSMLVHGDRWLHPDSVPLFDNSVVADTVSWCGSAVVTQRYEAPQGGSADGYNLTSGVLNPYGETPLLLALLGPESSADFRICNTSFGELVGGIQTDFDALKTLARESAERLDTVEPALVALRSDSVVVAVNEALAKQLGRQRAELEGRTTDEITAMLADRSMQIAEAIRRDDAVLPVSTVGFRRTSVMVGGLRNQSARRLSARLATSAQQIADSVSRLSQSAAESDRASLSNDLSEVAVHAQQTADIAAALRRKFGTNQSGTVRQ